MANEFVVKNGLHIPYGVLAGPSLAFSGDLDTGIYHSAADTFNLVSGAASRISIGDTVSVTPRPGFNFEVQTGGLGRILLNSSDYFSLNAVADSLIFTTNARLDIYTGTGLLYISNDIQATTVRVAAGAGVKTLTLGSTNLASISTLQSGTAGTIITSTGFFTLMSSGATDCNIYVSGAAKLNIYTTNNSLAIYSGTGAINISTDAAATPVAIATGAAVKQLTLGSTNTTSSTTVQSGTGDILVSSQDAFTIAGLATMGNVSSIYTVNAGINIYTGTGLLAVCTDATANTVNIATGAGVKTLVLGSTNTTSGITIQSGGNGITVTSPGNISITSSAYLGTPAKVAMTTDVGGWIKSNGSYFVPAGGAGLQNLLQAIIATTESPGTIILGAGTHTIGWIAATTINQEVRIIGTGLGTIINFSSTDADCRLIFSSCCHLEGIKFTGPNPGWLVVAAVTLSGSRSVIRDCSFDCATWLAGASTLLVVDNTNILVDHCTFTPASVAGAAATDECIQLTANATGSEIRSCTFTCDFCSTNSINVVGAVSTVTIKDCYFECANVVGTPRVTLSSTSSYCNITGNVWSVSDASIGRIIFLSSGDVAGYHLIQGNKIAEVVPGNTRVSCVYIAQPFCSFDNNIIQTNNRIHGGAPDPATLDRAAIYILAHYTNVRNSMLYLSGTAQLGIVVRDTGNAAANAVMEGPLIENNYFHNICGNTAGPSNGYGVWVASNAVYRPRKGMISGNKFRSNSAVSSWGCGTPAASGADSWVLVGNGAYVMTAFNNGDWVSGGTEVVASNQTP